MLQSKSFECQISVFFLSSICLSAFICLQCDSKTRTESEAARFARFARVTFKEVYPSLAEQILNDYMIHEGLCLDIGCGPGFLSIEIAKQSNLKIIGLDIDPEAVLLAENFIKQAHLENQIKVEQGDVHQLPFADETFDLIISRGSFLFWENLPKAFREINRVLKPGGVAFIGGGMGRAMTPGKKAAIKLKVEQAGFLNQCSRLITPVMMQEILESLNIQDFKIMGDRTGDSGRRCGLWVEIQKNQKRQPDTSDEHHVKSIKSDKVF